MAKSKGSKQRKAKAKEPKLSAAGVPMRVDVKDVGDKNTQATYELSTMLAGKAVSIVGTQGECIDEAQRTKGLEVPTVGAFRKALADTKAGKKGPQPPTKPTAAPKGKPVATVEVVKLGKGVQDTKFKVYEKGADGSYSGNWEQVLEWAGAVAGLEISVDMLQAAIDAKRPAKAKQAPKGNGKVTIIDERNLPRGTLTVERAEASVDTTAFTLQHGDLISTGNAQDLRKWARAHGIQSPAMSDFRKVWDACEDKPEAPTLAPPKARKSATKRASYKERAAEQPVGDLPTKDQLKVVYDEVQSNTKPRAEGGGWLSFNGSGRSTGDRTKLWGKISFGVGFGPSDLEAANKAAAKLKRKWPACEAEVYQTRPSKQHGSYPCVRLRYAG